VVEWGCECRTSPVADLTVLFAGIKLSPQKKQMDAILGSEQARSKNPNSTHRFLKNSPEDAWGPRVGGGGSTHTK